MKRVVVGALVTLLLSAGLGAQRGTGQLHLSVVDETGLAVRASGELEGDTSRLRRAFTTDERGMFVADALPFGVYRVRVDRPGFATATAAVEIKGEVPTSVQMTLRVAPVQATVSVTPPPPTLIDPFVTGSTSVIGADQIGARLSAAPGRSIADLVNTRAGWLLEANGVLHPRGSEYQVQYVVDGIPLRDNRSPAFAQSLGVDEFESLTVRTGGYPAEFGGKLGGVIEVNTVRDPRTGFHGTASLQAGSFSTLGGFMFGQYGAGRTSLGVTLEGTRTDRYLDPPVEANFTNDATTRGIALHFDRAWSDATRTRAYADHRSADFLVPNEAIQEAAGQRQSRTSAETLVQATNQHVFSPDVLGSVRFMARDTGATLASNLLSTPIRPDQDRSLREVYVNGDVAVHHGRHEFKLGGDATFGRVEEAFAATITAYRLAGVRVFDSDLPGAFSFAATRPDREQAVYAQDVVRFGAATVSLGVRYDHYRLTGDEQAVSPRLAASWYAPRADLLLRASYDRAFQTPAVENVLLASSNLVQTLGGQGQSLTLRASRGHFLEVGVSKAIGGRLRLDASAFRRTATNFADDDLLLNTAVSFPIAFSNATVRGWEAVLDVPRWGRASGSLTYSHLVGIGELPISGGLFLGDDAAALLNSTETFPLSQDQRHTLRGRGRYRVNTRVWVAASAQYNSGLPTEIDEAVPTAFLVQQFGEAVVDRVDFAAGRVGPSSTLDASVGWDVVAGRRGSLRVQADVFNLADRLNVINFAGLLSGTAVGPRRSWAVRAHVDF